MRGGEMETFPIPGSENAKGCLAQPRRLFEHRVEHRSEVAGRGIDDLQYLCGRGLLGECLVEPLTQLRVGTPKFFHLVVERRGHVLLRPTLSRSYDTRVSFRLHPRSMLPLSAH